MANTSFTEGVNTRVKQLKGNIRIAVPAVIVSINDYETLQCVDVKPVINDIYTRKDASVLEVQTLRKVFVKLDAAGGFVFKFPVRVDDKVTLHWSDKDLGKWLDGEGDSVDQSVTETGELEDCWVQLGFGTRKVHQNPSKDNFIFAGDNNLTTVTPEGDITSEYKTTTLTADSTKVVAPVNTYEGSLTVTEKIDATEVDTGALKYTSIETSGQSGVSGSFVDKSDKVVTVVNGIITDIT